MRRGAVCGVVAALAVLAVWLHREEARGTFAFATRPFLSWLAANASPGAAIPPLTLVLYDADASALAGGLPMGVQEATLFVRGAARLGAVAAGIDGLAEDPRRVLDASQGIFVFGGYAQDRPPDAGWAVLRGEPCGAWPEIAGLPGRPGIFPRGFIEAPRDSSGGARRTQVVARCGGRSVPSFLAIAWGAGRGWRTRELAAGAGGVKGRDATLLAGSDGAAFFLPGDACPAMTMNDFLVAAEKHDREGGESALRGRILVLARATPDVARFAGAGSGPATAAELWAEAWGPIREGKLFLLPGWWFPFLLVAAASSLAVLPSFRSSTGAVGYFLFGALLYLLAALGSFSGARVLLAPAPALILLASAALFGRLATLAGWRGSR